MSVVPLEHQVSAPAADPSLGSISLALGAGGARGLAHIGVIQVLEQHGYAIRAIAGSSMGAVVGGIYAAGKLDAYLDWVVALERFDVLRLIDWTLSGAGLIKGERVIGALRDLVGDITIEQLPIAFTAVATDLDREREVWLSRGPLFDAVRASSSIPGLVAPFVLQGRTLVDGGLLDPLPIAPTLRDLTDFTFAVDVNGPAEDLATPSALLPAAERSGYKQKIGDFLENLIGRSDERTPPAPGWRDLVARSLDTMQGAITRLKLATHEPDLLIQIPRNACAFYEFYRAREKITLGAERAERALQKFDAHTRGRRRRI
jgi:NTE family protein